jgi:hypothetical protein
MADRIIHGGLNGWLIHLGQSRVVHPRALKCITRLNWIDHSGSGQMSALECAIDHSGSASVTLDAIRPHEVARGSTQQHLPTGNLNLLPHEVARVSTSQHLPVTGNLVPHEVARGSTGVVTYRMPVSHTGNLVWHPLESRPIAPLLDQRTSPIVAALLDQQFN